jgi:hypothetical protein
MTSKVFNKNEFIFSKKLKIKINERQIKKWGPKNDKF